jgi:hypothetical protein
MALSRHYAARELLPPPWLRIEVTTLPRERVSVGGAAGRALLAVARSPLAEDETSRSGGDAHRQRNSSIATAFGEVTKRFALLPKSTSVLVRLQRAFPA